MIQWKKIMKEWVIPFGLEILVVILIVKFVCFFAFVPTGSMLPTVEEHSWLFATRLYQPEKNVQRGDILVFRSDELDETLLKRCIGLPGDHVELAKGELYINGEPYDEPYVIYDNTEISMSFDVPQGCFLFLGDNRAASYDARFWVEPYIPGDQIIGKARFAIWPLNRFGALTTPQELIEGGA